MPNQRTLFYTLEIIIYSLYGPIDDDEDMFLITNQISVNSTTATTKSRIDPPRSQK